MSTLRRTNLLNFLCSLIATVAAAPCGNLPAVEEPGKTKDEDARQKEQTKKLQRSASQHTLCPADDPKRPFQFHADPLMRWSNPLGGAKDGAVYIWSDGHRPQAIFKIFSHDGDVFHHEWQSLAEGAIVAQRGGKDMWTPTEPGIAFRALPDAPAPAESAAARLRQMKSLAGKFTVTSTRLAKDAKPTELRLLVQPLFRFETGNNPPRPDGALFGFSEGTDPMALLLLEVRRTKEGERWHYAVVRMTTFAVVVSHGGKEVYSADKYDFRRNPKEAFLQLPRQPVPKE
jgi:hypothetical protein